MKTRYNNFSDEELSKLISEKQAYINKLWEEATLPWQDYVEEVNKTNIWEMEVELNNRRVPILRDTDEFEQDCRETYKSFKQSCKFHCIMYTYLRAIRSCAFFPLQRLPAHFLFFRLCNQDFSSSALPMQ